METLIKMGTISLQLMRSLDKMDLAEGVYVVIIYAAVT